MYSIKKISIDEAKIIWDSSPNANAFNNPTFLKYFKNLSIYAVFKGKEIFCCWPLQVKKNADCLIPDMFYYFGPFWSNKIKNIPYHSWLSYSSKVYELFLSKFTKKFKKINFELHYTLHDVRIFDWWNYNKNRYRFIINSRYTALIDDLKKKNENQIISDYRYSRRYELKKFKKIEKEIIETEIKTKELLNLYFKVVKVKNIKDKKAITKNIEIFNKLSKKKLCKTFAYKSKKTNKLISVIILAFDNLSSHLILSVSDEEWKKKGIMTWSIHKAIMFTKNKNLNSFDFNGANSPQRGDHKHSFGSKTKLFFNLNFKQ
tara:strand:+ start:1513 stop:2463 length:951 start_codon:yes stop_codon:yes gene_type:complete